MGRYRYNIIIEAESEDEATTIIKEIKQIVRYKSVEKIEKEREIRTKIIEEFAKTESGKAMDSFMQKWNGGNCLPTSLDRAEFWSDVVKLEELIKKEEIKNVEREGYDFKIRYFNPDNRWDSEWYFKDNSMKETIEASKIY